MIVDCFFSFNNIVLYFQIGIEYYYEPLNTKCTWIISDAVTSPKIALIAHIFMVIIPLILPVIPIILSCILSVYAMMKSIDVSHEMTDTTNNSHVINEKKKVTLTVIVVTFVYIIFNVPPVITVILYSVGYIYPEALTLFNFDYNYYYYNNFQEIFCVGLNSSVNPIIYAIFMPTFREYFLRFFKRARQTYADVSESINMCVL